MAEVFANSEDPDQMPHSALFANYPFRGLPTTIGYSQMDRFKLNLSVWIL